MFIPLLVPKRISGRWFLLPRSMHTARSCGKCSFLHKHQRPQNQHKKTQRHLEVEMTVAGLTPGPSLIFVDSLKRPLRFRSCKLDVFCPIFRVTSFWDRPLAKQRDSRLLGADHRDSSAWFSGTDLRREAVRIAQQTNNVPCSPRDLH